MNRYSEGSNPQYRAFMYHGILGSKKNMATFAREFSRANTEWEVCVFDVRNHGDSLNMAGADDLSQCARDIVAAHQEFGPIDMLIGHSFSGKTVLEYAKNHANSELKTVWILDTIPMALAEPANTSSPEILQPQLVPLVIQVLNVIEEIKLPISSRTWLAEHFKSHGISVLISSWITTCLKATPDGLVWAFDVNRVKKMLDSYIQADYCDYLSQTTQLIDFKFVRGEQSERWTPEVLSRMEAISSSNHRVTLSMLEKAGHFVHSDNLAGLLKIME